MPNPLINDVISAFGGRYLVEFLSREKGTKEFAAFVRDGERDSYEDSLRRHYGWDFAELDRRWQRYAFPIDKSADTANGEDD